RQQGRDVVKENARLGEVRDRPDVVLEIHAAPLAVRRRRHKAAIFLLEQLGELDAGVVAVLRADDLDADRQAVARLADRCGRAVSLTLAFFLPRKSASFWISS